MKKLYILAVILASIFLLKIGSVEAYVSVKEYYRSNGTYVAPYVRSNPNGLKSDNYGYTPSQGAYNPTYGTRGTEWDTPTTITDPDYYEGKALYDAGKTKATNTSLTTTTFNNGNLTIGSRGTSVITLQNFLISKNIGLSKYLAKDGRFGPMTKKALADYQTSVGISPAFGYYGPITRAYVSTH